MASPACVTKADLEANPGAIWNAFIELIASTPYDDLTPSQQPAALVLSYDMEVQNGGHLQYFTNFGTDLCCMTIHALTGIGASAQAALLERALSRWNSAARLRPTDALKYSAVALEAEFDDLDLALHECPISLVDLLQRYLDDHETDFIVRS